ncbi:DUF2752 domain-containing protein [Actinomadura luteofluorescens]|uniref:DUF2752 domain-containing protein n=1 Tax=Actinomadura luteofluorescens TaxID=46163 RepID=UPI0036445321
MIAFRADPNEPGHYPGCPFLALTGYYCPGCGMTRLVYALAHGHVGTAFGLNPLLFVLLPVFGYLYARWTLRTAQGLPMRSALFTRPSRIRSSAFSSSTGSCATCRSRTCSRPDTRGPAGGEPRRTSRVRDASEGAATIGARNDLK